MANCLIVVAGKRLRDIALRVDLAFGPGVTALAGPSGAGKTTLLRLVAGLTHPDEGTISLDGVLLDDAASRRHVPPDRRNVGVVFQEYALFPHLSVYENVAYGLRARRVARAERRRRVGEILERLGIAALAPERPAHLSGGQRQRVALARALVVDPAALLLDEPLAALDVQTRAAVRLELRAILAGLTIPTVLVTHDYADALVFRERIVILDAGQVVQDGPHDELLARPRTRFVADFTGLNFLEGLLERHEAERLARIRVDDGVDVYASADDLHPGPVGVALRPWDVVLSMAPPHGSARNVLAGRVREALPLGGRVRVTLAAGDRGRVALVAEITPESCSALGCHEGQQLYASFKATAVSVTPLGE